MKNWSQNPAEQLALFALLCVIVGLFMLPSKNERFLRAVASHDVPRTRKLIAKGANVNWTGKSGAETALMLAASAGSREIVELLLLHGANKQLVDSNGWTAYDYALKSGQSNLLSFLEYKNKLDEK